MLEDRLVGGREGDRQPLRDRPALVEEHAPHDLLGERAGEIAGRVPAHAVSHQQEIVAA